MFDADRPILKSEQDRLGRSVFGKYLARCILDHKAPESLVIGLYGGWGCGKTSIINLTLEELQVASSNMLDDEKPVVLNFSPWSYSGQHQLIYAFFRRLSSSIRQATFLENADKIIQLLELYVSFFTHQPIPKAFLPKRNVVQKIAKPRRTKEDFFGWESGRDLTLVKADLNELLCQQKHKFIIFIDNISRIEPMEMNQIFQIVKSMGDYANTVYILSIDKKFVVNAMNKIHGGGGENYLEKVVQLPFEIPTIAKQDIENILLDRLKDIIKIAPEGAWDNNYWADIYYSTLKNFFHSCRDVTHYINSLSFSYPRVSEVVNPIDYFAISAIEVFFPKIYAGIHDNKDLFTDLVNNIYEPGNEKLIEDRARCDEILKRGEYLPQDILQQLLIRLFPRLRSIYNANIPFYHSESLARKNRRICSSDMFDVYFRMSISSGSISDAEMNAILSLIHDKENFAMELWRLIQDERIIKFLDLLDSTAVNKIPIDKISNVIEAITDSADLFPECENNVLRFNTPTRVHRILHQLLMRLENAEERFAIFSKAIKNALKSLYIIIHEINLQNQQHLENETTFIPLQHRDFTPDQLISLEKLAVEKIIYWAKIGRLAEHPKLIPILYAWKAWGDEAECRHFVGNMVQEDKGLVAFLCAALKEPIDQAITKLEKNPAWLENLNNIEEFISINILEPHAKMMFEDQSFEKLREREQLALLIFLDLIKSDNVKILPKTSV